MFNQAPNSPNYFVIDHVSPNDYQIYELGIASDEATMIDFEQIGLIKYTNVDFIAFALNKAERYGMFMTSRNVIIYFEFDTDAEWDKTTGSRNNLNSAIEDAFRLNGV